MNRIAYAWLIITEAFEEIFCLVLVDPIREFLSATGSKYLGSWADLRQQSRTLSEDRQGTFLAL